MSTSGQKQVSNSKAGVPTSTRVVIVGAEAVLPGNEVVGSTASIVHSETVDKLLAFAYRQPQAAVPGTSLSVVIAGRERAAVVHNKPVYDPQSKLPRNHA